MTAPAAIRSYEDLIQVVRARAFELETTRLQIDDVAGLTAGHSSSCFQRNIFATSASMSFGLVLQALGIMLIAVEDPEAMARIRGRYGRRLGARPAELVEYGDNSGVPAISDTAA